MIPAPFDYVAAESAAHAIELLSQHGDDAKVLAGGHSLLPMMKLRLAAPEVLIDIARVADLAGISVDGDELVIGATTRHADLASSELVRTDAPLLAHAAALVGDPQIRHRGTIGGSLAHADPAGEMTAVLALCGGTVSAVSVRRGRRVIAAADFFRGPLESALAPDELAIEAFFPALERGAGSAFVEIARRRGDYALCGVGAIVELDAAGDLGSLRCGYLSVTETPLVIDLTDAWRAGQREAADQARSMIDPQSDLHATADYRRHLAGVLTIRAARQAVAAAERGDRAA